jgi:hypothetical protein
MIYSMGLSLSIPKIRQRFKGRVRRIVKEKVEDGFFRTNHIPLFC